MKLIEFMDLITQIDGNKGNKLLMFVFKKIKTEIEIKQFKKLVICFSRLLHTNEKVKFQKGYQQKLIKTKIRC